MPNVTVYDLENYPDNGKTVSVVLASLVPVGAEGDDDGTGSDLGAVYILFLTASGTVLSNQKISDRSPLKLN